MHIKQRSDRTPDPVILRTPPSRGDLRLGLGERPAPDHQEACEEADQHSPIDIRNGRYQLPVASMTKPAISGETMAANADPRFKFCRIVCGLRASVS